MISGEGDERMARTRKNTTSEPRTATRVIGYVRVSTEKQADEGISLDAQRSKLRAFAQLFGLVLVRIEEDAGLSGATLDRPGLRRALAALESGMAEGVVVVALSRLTRSVRDLGDLLEGYFASGRFALLSVGESIDTRSAAGRLVLTVLGAVSAWEREACGERTAAALAQLRAEGKHTGGEPPFGWRVAKGGRLVEDSREQEALELIAKLRARGKSFQSIADALVRRGVPNRGGGRWLAPRVHALYRRRRVAS